ncbi:uncharacterized protein [Mytilus edulis]|uniref:uncharacterized protein n=1 Tax=Mytilus edulis TaxID=6550 RepID=UPI0039F12F3D
MKMVRLGSVGLILISSTVHVILVSGLVKDVEILHASTTDIVHAKNETANNFTGLDNINRPGVDTDIETSSSLKSLKYSLIDMLIIGFVCITTTAMLSVSLTILYFKYVSKQEEPEEKIRSYEDLHSASSSTAGYANVN